MPSQVRRAEDKMIVSNLSPRTSPENQFPPGGDPCAPVRFFAGIAQLLGVILAEKLHRPESFKSVKKLLAA